MRRVYVASSWRNEIQPGVVQALRAAGHQVYDFKNPRPGDHGFHWSDIDPNWKSWTVDQYREALRHPIARDGFASDFNAMQWADTFVLVLPCGRSAHLELGWAAGQGKEAHVLSLEPCEPELMVNMILGDVHSSIESVVQALVPESAGAPGVDMDELPLELDIEYWKDRLRRHMIHRGDLVTARAEITRLQNQIEHERSAFIAANLVRDPTNRMANAEEWTPLDRAQAVITFAKACGFAKAEVVVWDPEAPESGLPSMELSLEDCDEGVPQERVIGIDLHEVSTWVRDRTAAGNVVRFVSTHAQGEKA